MNSKATPIEQDPFAMRVAARLVTHWAQSLEQADSGVEMRHAQAVQALRKHISVMADPEAGAKVKRQGRTERANGVNQTQYHMLELDSAANSACIGVSQPPSNRTAATHAMEGLHASRLADAMERLQTNGWSAAIDAKRRPKRMPNSFRHVFNYLRVGMPAEHGADAIQALIADLNPAERASFIKQLVGLAPHGKESFSTELLENPYDPARLIDNEIAARVIATRVKHYEHEREPLEQFAEKHGITNAVKALGRGGNRELGA